MKVRHVKILWELLLAGIFDPPLRAFLTAMLVMYELPFVRDHGRIQTMRASALEHCTCCRRDMHLGLGASLAPLLLSLTLDCPDQKEPPVHHPSPVSWDGFEQLWDVQTLTRCRVADVQAVGCP